MLKVLGLTLVGLLLVVPALHAQEVTFLPDSALHLELARYAPAETELAWPAWVGAGVGLVRVREATAYLAGDVETILGQDRRLFDADQVNYHLEGGARLPLAGLVLVPFFHHVSRHLIDRPKTPNEDWNLVGLRATGRLPAGGPLRGGWSLGLGHTVETKYVTYGWELAARLDAGLLRFSWGEEYLRMAARAVSTGRASEVQSGGFLDLTLESGLRLSRGERRLDLYLAYEHRNDVLLLTPGSRDRALFGLRLVSSPPSYLDPVWP